MWSRRISRRGHSPPHQPPPTVPPTQGPRTSMVAPTPGHHYCFVHGWTTSHGWKAGKWAGTPCRILHAVPSPYSTQQANCQDPSLGGNANVYVVRALPFALPSRVSPLTVCSLCLPPSTPQKSKTNQQKFLPFLPSTSPSSHFHSTLFHLYPPLCPYDATLGADGPHGRGPSPFFSSLVCLPSSRL